MWWRRAWQDVLITPMIEHLGSRRPVGLGLCIANAVRNGDPASSGVAKGGYRAAWWVYCMLLNFGCVVGLHGKMDALIDGFYDAKADVRHRKDIAWVKDDSGRYREQSRYELVMELPWREHRFTRVEWLKGYVHARCWNQRMNFATSLGFIR